MHLQDALNGERTDREIRENLPARTFPAFSAINHGCVQTRGAPEARFQALRNGPRDNESININERPRQRTRKSTTGTVNAYFVHRC